MLDAPGPRGQRPAGDDRAGDQTPVGADDAVEAELLAEQPGEDLPVVAEADLLDGLAGELEADRHPVVGHQRPRCRRRRPGGTAPGGPRSARPGRPARVRTGSAGPRRRAAGRRPGSAWPSWPPRSDRGPGRSGTPRRTRRRPRRRRRCRCRRCGTAGPSAARCRGRSAGAGPTGCRRATYSCRATSANSRTRSGSCRAARPRGSGQADIAPAVNAAPAFSANEWRGSVLTVTGIECGVVAASACSAFDQRADSRAVGSACTLTWLIPRSTTTARVEERATRPSPSISVAARTDLDDVVEEQPDLLGQRQPRDAGRRRAPPACGAGPRTGPSPRRGRGRGTRVPSGAVRWSGSSPHVLTRSRGGRSVSPLTPAVAQGGQRGRHHDLAEPVHERRSPAPLLDEAHRLVRRGAEGRVAAEEAGAEHQQRRPGSSRPPASPASSPSRNEPGEVDQRRPDRVAPRARAPVTTPSSTKRATAPSPPARARSRTVTPDAPGRARADGRGRCPGAEASEPEHDGAQGVRERVPDQARSAAGRRCRRPARCRW